MSLKTPLGRVRGHGSAKDGTHHWWMQRLSALALIPLTIWFTITMVMYTGADYQSAIELVGSPLVMIVFLLLIGAVFYHAQLGLQVVVEDYIHTEWLKMAALIGTRFVFIVFAVAAAVSVIRISLGILK